MPWKVLLSISKEFLLYDTTEVFKLSTLLPNVELFFMIILSSDIISIPPEILQLENSIEALLIILPLPMKVQLLNVILFVNVNVPFET